MAAGYHCFSFDARCHGATTTPPDASRSWHGVADDLLAAVDALGLDGCLAAGHSMGSSALLLASLRRPGAFQALYCYEPVTAGGHRRADEGRGAGRDHLAPPGPLRVDRCGPGQLLLETTVRCLRGGIAGGVPHPLLRARSRSRRPRRGHHPGLRPHRRVGAVPARAPSRALRAVARHHRAHHGGGRAQREPGSPSSFAAGVVQLLPRARLWRHHELGHFGPQQDPAAIAGEIIRAWADPPAAGTHTNRPRRCRGRA
ncbi:MAG: alpha/beta hydrolase [Acidimicrobiales bacterium]